MCTAYLGHAQPSFYSNIWQYCASVQGTAVWGASLASSQPLHAASFYARMSTLWPAYNMYTHATASLRSACRFRDAQTGLEVDLCVSTRGTDFKGHVLRALHGMQPQLKPLIRLVGGHMVSFHKTTAQSHSHVRDHGHVSFYTPGPKRLYTHYPHNGDLVVHIPIL